MQFGYPSATISRMAHVCAFTHNFPFTGKADGAALGIAKERPQAPESNSLSKWRMTLAPLIRMATSGRAFGGIFTTNHQYPLFPELKIDIWKLGDQDIN